MRAINCPFTKIINGTTQFIIPVFQRDYSWTEEECDQLWKDVLLIAGQSDDRGHFLGSVVYVSTGDSTAGFTRWLLIDGQQRVTTLILLLTALRDHINATGWAGTEDGPTARRVEAYFLKNVQEEGSRQHKLVLRRHDQDTLCALLDKSDMPREVSPRLRDNYEFFRECLKEADPEAVYRGISRLVVVDVTLERGVDDPQLIFESLNSTGMDLSQSDLIRNFILMRTVENEQSRLYDMYWSQIENLFRGSEATFDAFIRDYLAIRTKASKQEKADRLYFAFRREFGSIGPEPARLNDLLAELLRFAKYHAAFSIGSSTPELLREPMSRLRRLSDGPATIMLRLFECFDSLQAITIEEFAEATAMIESYIFRRAICGEQTHGYWQVFANLAYAIDPQRPLESLKVGFARLPSNYKFPTNEEFEAALEGRDIYAKRVCFDLLERLENYGSKEVTDTTNYSIEHIMPQNENLVSEWKGMLGDRWRDVQREWLHRLGNLTLTAYNSRYSDRPFNEKKVIAGGFEESSVRLNKFVREQEVWTASEMERRGKSLAHQALTIWAPLIVEKELIDAAAQTEMRALALRRDVTKVSMSSNARTLFTILREEVMKWDPTIIELAEQKSVSYYGPDYFLEVLPRKGSITLLLDIAYNELVDAPEIAKDASEWKFVVNAVHEGGVNIAIREAADINTALPVIRQAWERAGK